jgi:predicted permease
MRRVEARPGVAAAAVTTWLPAKGSGRDNYEIEGKAYADERALPSAYAAAVSPGYFHTFGTAVVAGRNFGPEDRAGGAPVTIVNQSFARLAWPGADAVGRRIRVGRGKDAVWRTVVGVAPDLGMRGLQNNETGEEGFYVPLSQDSPGFATLVVATRGRPLALVPTVRAEVSGLDPDIPVYFVQSMAQVVAGEAFFFNMFGTLFAVLGGCALVLASVGIYGVIAFSVQQRTQEIGVRMALGARRGNVLGMILRQGSIQLGIGLGAGLLLAFLGSRPLRALLFEVDPTDPPTYALVSFVLCAVALSACLVPARRAARLDPQIALRT